MIAEDVLNSNSVSVEAEGKYAFFADVSDIHMGDKYHDEKRFKDFIKLADEIPNLYVIIGGDSTNNASTQSKSSVFEEAEHGSEQIQRCVEMLKPIRNRIVGIRSGNHGLNRAMKYNRLIPEEIIAQFLGVPFLQGCATVFLKIGDYMYTIGTWHNSKNPNKMEWLHTDVTFYEHLHKNDIQRQLIMEPNKFTRKWIAKEHWDIQSGSFLGWGGYAAEKGYRPVPDGCPVIRLCGTKREIIPYYDIWQIIS